MMQSFQRFGSQSSQGVVSSTSDGVVLVASMSAALSEAKLPLYYTLKMLGIFPPNERREISCHGDRNDRPYVPHTCGLDLSVFGGGNWPFALLCPQLDFH